MMRSLVPPLVGATALAGALAGPSPGTAGLLDGLFGGGFGGGAIYDHGLWLREAAIIGQRDEDLALQADRRANAQALLEIEREQLAALDAILASVQAGPDSGTLRAIEDLEGDGTAPDSAGVLYGPEDPNPGAARLFGDAAVTVEELII